MNKRILTFETAFKTHTGMIRSNNEDSLFVVDKRFAKTFRYETYGIYIIADGMGGHEGGEIASEIATRVVSTYMSDNIAKIGKYQNPSTLVKTAINEANKKIYQVAKEHRELQSMGTTMTMGLRLDNELYIGHAGDSRAYLLRGREIKQLTSDHSLTAYLIEEGAISVEDAILHPERGVIFRYLGIADEVNIDTQVQGDQEDRLLLEEGDCLILCSDGLTNCVKDKEIYNNVRKYIESDDVCNSLVDLANSRGGTDNISVIVTKVKANLWQH